MSFSYRIERITAQDCLDLRSRILRPGQDLALCQYPEDNLESTLHLGVIYQEQVMSKVICNGTFMHSLHKDFPTAQMPYRLRGMATDFQFRKLHLGSQLIQEAEIILKNINCDFLWFNARESAFGFYEKNGFLMHGEMFDIPLIGPHKVMYKWLMKN